MNLRITESFMNMLSKQIDYIAKDKPSVARKFQKAILLDVRKITKRPYSYRKSIYADREDVREMIFKGYKVIFKITKTEIEVFGFINYQNSLND